jgi:hypothetical protein
MVQIMSIQLTGATYIWPICVAAVCRIFKRGR